MGILDPGQLRYLFLKRLHLLVWAQAELADRTCTTFDELVALSQMMCDGLRSIKVTTGKADRYTKAKSVLQLGSGSGAKAEPVIWAAPPATMSQAMCKHRHADRTGAVVPSVRSVVSSKTPEASAKTHTHNWCGRKRQAANTTQRCEAQRLLASLGGSGLLCCPTHIYPPVPVP